MTRIIAHRGPDDEGVYVSEDRLVGLGNRRLAILDLSPAGHMPMQSREGHLAVTYNGEIYNYPELRRRIEASGRTYRSRSDTEVLLHLYDELGPDFVSQLNGIFAFALWDEPRRQLLLARDRLGVKPLYYTVVDGALIFGSEIKSLLLAPGVTPEPDPEAINCLVSFRWLPAPLTGFKGIYKLPPGHRLLWRDGQMTIERYWDIPYVDPADASPRSAAAWIAEFRETFHTAVRRQLLSDVPVGVFLSGGLDSSAIVAAMAEAGQSVRSYTIAYRGEDQSLEQTADETGYARLVAERFGCDHSEIPVAPDMTDLLPKLVWHMDEPVADPAAISTFMISQTARPDVRVLLSGQGADELLGGYRLYTSHRLAAYYGGIPAPARRILSGLADQIPLLRDRVPGVSPGLVLAAHRYLSTLTRYGALPMVERHVAYHSNFGAREKQVLLSPEFRAAVAGYGDESYHRRYFDRVRRTNPLEHFLYVDQKTFLPELNLTYADKMGMAASVEVRVPFLDNDLVDLAARIPPRLKVRGLTGKYVLRQAMRDVLPAPILSRRKAAFGAPIRNWLRRDLRPVLDDLLAEDVLRRRGYFDPRAVAEIRHRAEQGQGNSAHQLWILLTLEIWHQVFIDNPGARFRGQDVEVAA